MPSENNFIHPLSIPLILEGSGCGGWCLSPAVNGQKAGYKCQQNQTSSIDTYLHAHKPVLNWNYHFWIKNSNRVLDESKQAERQIETNKYVAD